MVRGSDSGEAPDESGQDVVGPPGPFPPPVVPEVPEQARRVEGRRRVDGEESRESEQSCLPEAWVATGLVRDDLGEALERPAVVLESEGGEEGFPEGLIPVRDAGADPVGLCLLVETSP
jgi:hypothetical protein